MEWVYILLIGFLYAASLYMILRRSLVKLILGILLLTQAANLTVFIAAGLNRGGPALIEVGSKVLDPQRADPLPQALILTAIVIGFGVSAFALVLIKRIFQTTQSEDIDSFNQTDHIGHKAQDT